MFQLHEPCGLCDTQIDHGLVAEMNDEADSTGLASRRGSRSILQHNLFSLPDSTGPAKARLCSASGLSHFPAQARQYA
jgi:hypothetical protein